MQIHTKSRFLPPQSPAVISPKVSKPRVFKKREGSSVFLILRDILRRPVRCTINVFVEAVTKDLYALLFLCLVSLRVPSLKVVSVCV